MNPPQLCRRCGAALAPDALACPNCGQLIHVDRLNSIAGQATLIESQNPGTAAMIWQKCLPLLPTNSPQYAAVQARINDLAGGYAMPMPADGQPVPLQYGKDQPQNDSLAKALLWTVGSMIVSIVVYSWSFGWQFATGFVLLILVHELGHVVANRYYGLKASTPIFVPYLGAVINLRQSPPNAKVEAIIGIGGPVFGAIASVVTALLAMQATPDSGIKGLLWELAFFGFLMNLFNLLPVPPLDGGRVTAAVSPWIWMLGVLGMVGLCILDFMSGHPSYILILVAFYAFPRIWKTLTTNVRNSPYYQIGWIASFWIGFAYVALLVLLIGGLVWAHAEGVQSPF